jgi:hypothetical protein
MSLGEIQMAKLHRAVHAVTVVQILPLLTFNCRAQAGASISSAPLARADNMPVQQSSGMIVISRVASMRASVR